MIILLDKYLFIRENMWFKLIKLLSRYIKLIKAYIKIISLNLFNKYF